MLTVKSLRIYPVKSGQGIDLDTAQLRPRGLAGDRRFMIVGKGGQFITQRQCPQLAQLSVRFTNTGLILQWPGSAEKQINFPDAASAERRIDVTVWRSTVNAAFVMDDVNAALSDWLGQQAALVYMDDAAQREASIKWTGVPSSPVSFADGYPVLVTNMASLSALNTYILGNEGYPIPMNRFRSNIVIDGARAWAENDWKQIEIGDVILDLVKPCARCIITSIDQTSGKKRPKAALSALKHLNPSDNPDNPGVMFGMNAVVRKMGKIDMGAEIKILA
ncbi:MAG: MOSC N-terminal beta barrel domain-containing protein [Robiginitomaculum sp.]